MKFVCKEFLYIGFIYLNLKIKFIYDGISEFIYQGYIFVYLPKVYFRKPSLQAPNPNQYFTFLASLALRDQISHKIDILRITWVRKKNTAPQARKKLS